MAQSPFSYPGDDDTPYLQHFDGKFTSVFVALNPFLKLPDHPPWQNGEWQPDSTVLAAKLKGASCGVSWAEIALLCDFSSPSQVNRALRLTGSKRISAKYANPGDTARMLEICATQNIHLPDEGCSSPLLELSMGSFAQALGQDRLISAGHFGSSPNKIQALDLLDKQQGCIELWSVDRSLYCAINIDYHYHLICQTDESLRLAKPEDYFEGFYADTTTNDFWGIGDFSGAEQIL
ncbi:hypothetical protein [Phaeobacter porticola]|uniref:hypothetical protein n=1 Tax=Phaeobacter porticola TaxID=1844006 RepID=UPI0012FFD207|nr:hypothetical protein [Phaeobacter porticola]